MRTLVTLPPGVDAFDPTTWERATRDLETETIKSFSNSIHPRCFGCNSDLFLVTPLLVEDDFTLASAIFKLENGGPFVVYPWAWCVYPRLHKWSSNHSEIVDRAQAFLEGRGRYIDNRTTNLTPQGGGSAEHDHDWLLERRDTTNTGFAGTLLAANRNK